MEALVRRRSIPRSATALPRRSERWGLGGHVGAPMLIGMLGLVAVLVGGGVAAHAQDAGKKFGDAVFLRYEGTQSWPTGERSQIISDFAVPIYLGLPNKGYK